MQVATKTRESPSLVAYAAPFVAACLWGGSFVAAKVVMTELHPLVAAAARFVSVAILLGAWASLRQGELKLRLPWRDWRLFLAMGVVGTAIPTASYFYGLTLSTAINSSLVNSGQPAVTALCAALLLREATTPRQALGIFISLVGIAYIVAGGSLELLLSLQVNPGDLMFVVAVAAWSLGSVLTRIALRRFNTVAIVTYQSLVGGVLLALLALPFFNLQAWSQMSLPIWVGLIYLIVPGSLLGMVLWYEGINRLGVSRTAAFSNVMPVAGVVAAWFVLGETLTVHHIVGAGLVFLGVYLAAARPAQQP